jgi:hypothetical protein
MLSDIRQKFSEPYIKLPILKKKDNFVIYNQTFRQKEKYLFFQKAFDYLYSNSIQGDYFEFGIHKARTFRFALVESYIRKIKMDFYAFDSFAGLPDVKNYKQQNIFFAKKKLCTSIVQFKRLIKNYAKNRKIEIIPGFYNLSLNRILIKKLKKKKVVSSFINIDCDLNESVKQSLDFSLNFARIGTILYVDDYYLTYSGSVKKGNPLIVKKLLKKHGFFAEPWHIVGSSGKSFLLQK